MNDRAIVEAVARLPVDFKAQETVSAVELIRRSGLVENPRALSAAAVRAYLVKNPALVAAWKGWSQDKRTSAGWYFSPDGGRYIVGFFRGGERAEFDDPFDACSAFILREAWELIGHVR